MNNSHIKTETENIKHLDIHHFIILIVLFEIIIICAGYGKSKEMPPAKFHDCLTELSSANFAENISQGKCFVLFYAADSGSCDKMRYNLGKIAENEQGTIRFFKLNIDDYPETALNYQISNTPNTLIFKNGEVLKRITGAIPKRNLEIIYNRISKK